MTIDLLKLIFHGDQKAQSFNCSQAVSYHLDGTFFVDELFFIGVDYLIPGGTKKKKTC